MSGMRKIFLNSDYSFFQKSIPVLGFFGLTGHLVFYAILHFGFNYWESVWLRLSASLLYGVFLFYPKDKALSLWHKIAFETIMAATLPALFTLCFLENGGNAYWYASLVFCGLVHGLVSKPLILLVSYPLAASAAGFAFLERHPDQHALVLESLKAQLIAFFLGLLATAIKSGMESTHEKIMSTRLALVKAESDLLRAEATRKAYEELKQREELIRIYVRPSLVDEIHAGKDPSKAPPVIRNLAIMFCDIRDFTRLTEVLTPYERQTFLNQYFTMMTHPIVRNGGEVDKIMGDCVMGVFPDGAAAVQAAIDMRLELQKFNEGMYQAGSPMIRNGIGIAKGEVMQANFGSFEKLDRTVIGEAVNIAARLEAKTKMYNLEVVVTEDVIRDLPPGAGHYRWIDVVQVKGSTRHLKLYEIYGHQPPEVRQFKDDTRDLLEKALTIYFQKGFKDASRLFHAMLENVPPHRLLPNNLMDNIIPYYIAHCDAWINDRTGTWEQIEKWEGVHIFYEK
jgi:class 3 adenylate cyclase